jgi:hypothetical protein
MNAKWRVTLLTVATGGYLALSGCGGNSFVQDLVLLAIPKLLKPAFDNWKAGIANVLAALQAAQAAQG